MPVQHSRFLAQYEIAPSRPPIDQLANYGYSMTGGLGGGGYIGLKSAVPDLLALSARLKPPRRASVDINRPAPDDFFMNKGGRSYDIVPSLIFERPSAGINSARSKTLAIQQKAALEAEIAVTRRFYERLNAPTLNFEGGLNGVFDPPSKALMSRRFTTPLSQRHASLRSTEGTKGAAVPNHSGSPTSPRASYTAAAASYATLAATVREIRDARAVLDTIRVPLNVRSINAAIARGKESSLLAAVGGNPAMLTRSLRAIGSAAASSSVPQTSTSTIPSPSYSSLAEELKAVSASAFLANPLSRPQSARQPLVPTGMKPTRKSNVLHQKTMTTKLIQRAKGPTAHLFIAGEAPPTRATLAERIHTPRPVSAPAMITKAL